MSEANRSSVTTDRNQIFSRTSAANDPLREGMEEKIFVVVDVVDAEPEFHVIVDLEPAAQIHDEIFVKA